MKIALIRRGYSPWGGAEAYTTRFAATLHAQGHQPVIVSTQPWPGEHPSLQEQIILPAKTPAAFAHQLQKTDLRQQCDLLFSLERIWDCDVYRAGDGVHRAWLERRAHHESWLQTHWRLLQPKHRQILALEAHLYRPQARHLIIANSQLVADEIHHHYGFPREQLAVIPNGIDPPSLPEDAREKKRRELGLAPDAIALLFAGSGWERKGIPTTLAALEKISDPRVVLLIAGKGSIPRHHPANIRYLGPRRDMPALYTAADLFVLPTLYDPFSNATLEALAQGLPIITSRDNGCSEIITHGTHGEILPDPRDSAALAAAITRWLDPEKLHTQRPVCRELALTYSMDRNLSKTLSFLKSKGVISPQMQNEK